MMKKRIGDYTLEELIGAGSFGEVFRATSAKSSDMFAVKMINRKTLPPQVFSYLEREVEMLQMVEHENVVKLRDLKVSENHYYLIFEYCNGGDLAAYTKKLSGKLPESQTRSLLRQVVQGLGRLYSLNGIHRDLKLSNILLHYPTASSSPVAKICDFGFARAVPGAVSGDMAMSIVGTPVNMAPEVLHGRPYSAKADMWSLGTVTYELLFGSPPFAAFSREDLIKAMERGRVSVPKDRGISAEGVDFVNACLQYDPKERIGWQELAKHPFIEGNRVTRFDFGLFSKDNEATEEEGTYRLSAHTRYDFRALYEQETGLDAASHAKPNNKMPASKPSVPGENRRQEAELSQNEPKPGQQTASVPEVRQDKAKEKRARSGLVFEDVADYVKVSEQTRGNADR